MYRFANETHIYYGADIIISVTDFIGDIILIYRCWVIWERKYYVVVVPFLTSLGGLGEYPYSQTHRVETYTAMQSSMCWLGS